VTFIDFRVTPENLAGYLQSVVGHQNAVGMKNQAIANESCSAQFYHQGRFQLESN
jgi:hypothetical protein